MIITGNYGAAVVEIALLKRPDGTKLRWFKTSEELEAFLKAHPDQDFLLESARVGDIIPPEVRAGHGADKGDIVCGQLRYSSTEGKVICS